MIDESDTSTYDKNHLKFALKFVKENFTQDEIKYGIFGDKNNNSRSKTQIPFTIDKVDLVKSNLFFYFN